MGETKNIFTKITTEPVPLEAMPLKKMTLPPPATSSHQQSAGPQEGVEAPLLSMGKC